MNRRQKDLVFVVSGGRTGTQFLGDRLSSAIQESFSIHDPDILSIYIKRILGRLRTFGFYNMTMGKAIGQTGIRSIGARLIAGRITRDTAITRLKRLRESYHESIHEPLVIESNSQWLYVCDELAEIWPHARVIIVVRDPRTWIRSWLNKGIRWRAYDPVRILPPGRLTPKEVGDTKWVAQWRNFDTLGRLAWEWRFVYTRLLAHSEINPHARIFRFEDLFCSDADTAMWELVAFAANHPGREYQHELPRDFTSNVHNASSGSAQDWPEWETHEARLVDNLCGPLMRRFGYGAEPEWRSKIMESCK